MKKSITVITILFVALITGILNDTMSMYNITHYIDIPFISAIVGILTFIYIFTVYVTVLHYKYEL
jgi:hypothetical protein